MTSYNRTYVHAIFLQECNKSMGIMTSILTHSKALESSIDCKQPLTRTICLFIAPTVALLFRIELNLSDLQIDSFMKSKALGRGIK